MKFLFRLSLASLTLSTSLPTDGSYPARRNSWTGRSPPPRAAPRPRVRRDSSIYSEPSVPPPAATSACSNLCGSDTAAEGLSGTYLRSLSNCGTDSTTYTVLVMGMGLPRRWDHLVNPGLILSCRSCLCRNPCRWSRYCASSGNSAAVAPFLDSQACRGSCRLCSDPYDPLCIQL